MTPGRSLRGGTILETPRLRLRELVAADAPFVLELLTDHGVGTLMHR